ncbi:MAG: response regulator [Candidatus Aminicenantes bacterium]|nr:MAG: response regulator [Candidatus Aminicenantes bacterium]
MKKENMLVVEDEDIMREALSDYFSDEGHKVDTADDGDKALEKFNLEDYNVMIVDLKLPGRDGLSVLKEIRAKNPKARVIIITAYPSIETAKEAIRGGATDYLPKPFELDYLETIIRQSYEVEIIPTPPVEEPLIEEEIVTPCIWMQAGLVEKRMCAIGYQCQNACKFHVAMMKKEKFREDPRIKPFLDKLYSQLGKKQCRYTMSGKISLRSCDRLYNCESCEFHQTMDDEVDRQLVVKAANQKRKQAKGYDQVAAVHNTSRSDH